MYSFITILSGVVLAMMVAVNGELSAQYGAFGSSLIVQIVGTIVAFIAIIVKKESFVLSPKVSKGYYLTGIVTASITVFQNIAFHHISMTSIIALGLVGQTLISLIIDQFALFGMKKTSPSKSSIVCLLFAIVGICVMADGTIGNSMMSIILSLAAGVAIVLSRIFNAKIAERTTMLQGSFISYILGLPAVALIAWFMKEIPTGIHVSLANSWMYLGGIFGVMIVFMCNLTALHVSAFKLTMFIFAGQVMTGIVLDLILQSFVMDASFWGGIIISIGILLSKILDR